MKNMSMVLLAAIMTGSIGTWILHSNAVGVARHIRTHRHPHTHPQKKGGGAADSRLTVLKKQVRVRRGEDDEPLRTDGPETVKMEPEFVRYTSGDQQPVVFYVSNILSAETCQAIIDMASDSMEQSRVIGGDTSVISEVRTSRGTFIPQAQPILWDCRATIAKFLEVPEDHIEDTQVLRYEGGQFYKPHTDYFGYDSFALKRGGQRIATALMWLNEVESGGATAFPMAEPPIKIFPTRGNGIVWYNVEDIKSPEPLSNYLATHEGTATDPGTVKWVMVLWIRQRRFV